MVRRHWDPVLRFWPKANFIMDAPESFPSIPQLYSS